MSEKTDCTRLCEKRKSTTDTCTATDTCMQKRRKFSPNCVVSGLRVNSRPVSDRCRTVLPFWSKGPSSVRLLSNFSTCTLLIICKDGQPRTFPSTEHFYQALKTNNLDDFTVGGAFAKWSILSTLFPKMTDEELQSEQKYWDGNIGILAKRVISKALKGTRAQKRALAVVLLPEVVLDTFEKASQLWKPILRAKLQQNPEVRMVLESSKNKYLLEFVRGAIRYGSRWGGIIKNKELYGQNWMGKIWMELIEKEAILEKEGILEKEAILEKEGNP
jgi:predicted NAD-dependent protein-ADP-ribosyltransferase YbiA (DUF1768 family)